MNCSLLLPCFAALCLAAAFAGESIEAAPMYVGVPCDSDDLVRLPGDAREHDIARRSELNEVGTEECLYADEQYIVVLQRMVASKPSARPAKKSDVGDAANASRTHDEAESENAAVPPTGCDARGGAIHVSPRSSSRAVGMCTVFYDSRTLRPLFYLPFAAAEAAFNRKRGLFALSVDPVIQNNTYRELKIVLLDPDARLCRATAFYGPALRGSEMTWKGDTLELRLEWGPMRKTFEIFRFDAPFLKSPVRVLSIDTSGETISYDEEERRRQEAAERRDAIRRTTPQNADSRFMLKRGGTPGSVAFTWGRDRLCLLDFDRLSFKSVSLPGTAIFDMGARGETHWIYSRDDAGSCQLTLLKNGESQSFPCSAGLTFLPDGSAAWEARHVFDVAFDGLTTRFCAPTGREIIGVDASNHEIYVQSVPDLTEDIDDDQWRERMMPSAYDWETGRLQTARCDWFDPGTPGGGAVENEGCAVGVAPKGWRLATHHDFFKRMNGLEGSLSLRQPSGKCARMFRDLMAPHDRIPPSVTADKTAALYRCGPDSQFLLLLYDGTKGGRAVVLHEETLQGREVASWPAGLPPLWMPSKNWLFVPGAESYDVLRLDARGNDALAFCFFPAPNGYAVVLPNGLYAGTPGCESLLRFRDEIEGLQRRAPWRNRPGDVLEALGGDRDSVRRLRTATAQWLEQINFNPDMPEPTADRLPRVEVSALPGLFVSSASLAFQATFAATKKPVVSYTLSVNDVVTEDRLDAPVPPGQEATRDFRIRVSEGPNRVELRAVDADGVAGDPFRFRVIGRRLPRARP